MVSFVIVAGHCQHPVLDFFFCVKQPNIPRSCWRFMQLIVIKACLIVAALEHGASPSGHIRLSPADSGGVHAND